jgi:hypothetical protein
MFSAMLRVRADHAIKCHPWKPAASRKVHACRPREIELSQA